MDFFYKPPTQRADECGILEENYMNCLMQKSLKDRVVTNKCVMDSILWFHLECPKAASAFDDPSTFKLKFRDYFAHAKHDLQVLYDKDETMEKLRQEYDTNVGPDGIRARDEVGDFRSEYKQHDPLRVPDEDGESDVYSSIWEEKVRDVGDRHYAPAPPTRILSVDDSAKFGSGKPYNY